MEMFCYSCCIFYSVITSYLIYSNTLSSILGMLTGRCCSRDNTIVPGQADFVSSFNTFVDFQNDDFQRCTKHVPIPSVRVLGRRSSHYPSIEMVPNSRIFCFVHTNTHVSTVVVPYTSIVILYHTYKIPTHEREVV